MSTNTLRIGTALVLLATGATAASARQHSHHGYHAARAHLARAHVARLHSRHHHHGQVLAERTIRGYSRQDAGSSVSRSCLTPDTQALLGRVESTFGPVQIISTCRPGAVVAGTGHPSMHRYGRAVDFDAPAGKKAAIVAWLSANNPGGTMTYAHMGHIHMDTGPRHFVSLGSGGRGARHVASRAYAASRRATLVASMPTSNPGAGNVGTAIATNPGYPPNAGYAANPGYAPNTGWANPGWAKPDRGERARPRRYAHHHHGRHARG
jgi:uncharacterized protein YcbK (DUF882 family)